MINNFRNKNFYFMVLFDLILFFCSISGAYLFRFDFNLPDWAQIQLIEILKYILPLKLGIFFCAGLYQGMWRYTGLKDLRNLVEASMLQTLLIIAFILYKFSFNGFSRGIFVIDFMLTVLLTSGARVMIRSFFAFTENHTPKNSLPNKKKTLIIGAGRAGERVIRDLTSNPSISYQPVGLIDKDEFKKGRTIHGVPVLGSLDIVNKVIEKKEIDEILIAIAEASSMDMREIISCCKKTTIPFKILPQVSEYINGKIDLNNIREVSYADLLGRSPVKLDTSGISDYLCNKTILVTGAGGSIGSELIRQIIKFSPSKIILFDSCEFNLHAIEMELLHEIKFNKYKPILGSIQNKKLLEKTFATYTPDVVFHAAAYKHVPMIEKNPWQAIHNNIIGTQNTMEAAIKHGVKRFVIVSTDKAVRPTNIMGASKRITELLINLYSKSETTFMAVRFGNVIGSSGSVVPLFKKQIELGGPVTVTHKEITRYFMSISEASQLILEAGVMAKGGEIFVLKMGDPIKIADMAKDLIILSGKIPDKDIKIEYTGLRAGEKLYEELITEGENIVRTEHEKIMVLKSDTHDFNLSAFSDELKKLTSAANEFDKNNISKLICEILPEFKHNK